MHGSSHSLLHKAAFLQPVCHEISQETPQIMENRRYDVINQWVSNQQVNNEFQQILKTLKPTDF